MSFFPASLENLIDKFASLPRIGSGTSWGALDPSHHTAEDIAALRALPNLTISPPTKTPLEATNVLNSDELHVSVYTMYSIKPIDINAILLAAQTCRAIITVEEHSIQRGAVAELLA